MPVEDRIEPADLTHRVGKLEFRLAEAYRRMAIYEKRILILEGKRDAGRLDDAQDWDEGVTPVTERNAVTPDVTPGVTPGVTPVTPVTPSRNANAERQRRYREKTKPAG